MKIYRFCSMKESFGLRLVNCGIEHCPPNFAMHPHSREVYLLHYVLEGDGIFECGGTVHPFSSRSLFAIFPHDVVSYRAAEDSLLKFCWVGIDGRNAAYMIQRVGLTRDHPVANLHSADSIVAHVRDCLERCDSAMPNADMMILSTLYRLFGDIEQNIGRRRTENPTGSATSIHVDRAKSYIEFNYMIPLSINQIARHVNLERTYFSRIFHEIEGASPQEYLLGYRIGIAKRLLLESRYSIKEVGALVGIPDQYYFSRVFKKATGFPPSKYSRKHAESDSSRMMSQV